MPNQRPQNLPAHVRDKRPASRMPGANTGPRKLPPPAGTEVIVKRTDHLIKAELKRAMLAGEIGAASPVMRLADGRYAVKVARIKPRPPRWRKPLCVAAGVLSGMLLVGWLLFYTLGSLVALIPGGAAGAGLLVGALLLAGAANHERIVEVWVRVRVRG